MQLLKSFYVYKHTRLDTNKVFYIGIGTKRRSKYERAYDKVKRSKYWKNITNITDYKVEIIFESENREEVKNKEKELITFYGRSDLNQGTLVNHSDGGDGPNGFIPTKLQREKSRERMIHLNKDKSIKRNYARNTCKVLNLETGEIYSSIIEAAKAHNLKPHILYDALNNKKNKTNFIKLCQTAIAIQVDAR